MGRARPFGPSLAQGVCPLAPAVGQHRTLRVGAAQPLRPNTLLGQGTGADRGLNPSGVGRSQAEPSLAALASPPEAHAAEVGQRTTSLQVPVRLRGRTYSAEVDPEVCTAILDMVLNVRASSFAFSEDLGSHSGTCELILSKLGLVSKQKPDATTKHRSNVIPWSRKACASAYLASLTLPRTSSPCIGTPRRVRKSFSLARTYIHTCRGSQRTWSAAPIISLKSWSSDLRAHR